MDNSTWEHHRLPVLTHVLTHQTAAPSLHSQLFVASRLPLYRSWDQYPPFLHPSPAALPRWSFSLFLRRAANLGFPRTSWRSKCPFQQPPPAVLSSAVDQAPSRWGEEERREWLRKRVRRRRLGVEVPPLVGIAVPNLLLFTLLLWDPLSLRRKESG